MRKLIMRGIQILCAWFISGLLLAQALGTVPTVPDYYQSALQAYLSGDIDQAILQDSKALQNNNQDKKAQALLSILVSEKDASNKTVIWIGGKPAVMDSPQTKELPAPVTLFRDRPPQPRAARASVDSRKLAELETRVQTVAFLMERDSFNQYRELNGAQVATNKRLEEISLNLKDLGTGAQHSNFLFLLALVLSALALWISWKNGQEVKKQQTFIDRAQDPENRDRVVNIRRL